jgi:hypothetical protein
VKTTAVLRFSAWMIVAMIGFTLAACEDEKQPEEVVSGPTGPLTVSSLISNPKVGAPGDTLVLTAVVTSDAANEGDFPVMDWTADGGTFLEDDKQTVRWVAPNASGLFTITARATNHVNSATRDITLFVGAGTELLHEFAGQVDLINSGPDFHYFFVENLASGIDVYKYVGGVASDAIANGVPPGILPGNPAYSADGSMVAWSADTLQGHTTLRPRHVNVGDLGTGTYTRLTVDGAKPNNPERNRFDMPSFSPNKQVVAYQRFAQAWDTGGADSFLVYVSDIVANTRTKVTYELPSPRAFFPTFSTDSKWLVYVLDRQKNGQWELYGSPMTGNTVDGSLASLTKLTDTGGLIVTGAPATLKRPLMAWNPVSPVLAIAAADGVLHLVQTTATGANDIPVSIRAQEIIWSPTGTMLAATYTETVDGDNVSKIATVTSSGALTERVVAPVGDLIRDVAFSPDENWMVYRVTRGGGSWFNLLDIGAGTLAGPVPVTATDPAGFAALYRGAMTLRPVWTSANLLIYPSFNDNASGTPGIYSRDLSGIVN